MPEGKARKILFASGKGGVGKSSLAVCMAKRLFSKGGKVLMVDCDICLRSLDILLGLSKKAVYDWSDVIKGNCNPNDAIIQERGPSLLVAPNNDIDIKIEQAKDLIKNYEEDFDYIIIDSPAGIGKGFKLALSMADEALVISTPDTVCVHSAYIAAEKIYDEGIVPRLIINKFSKREVLKSKLLNIDTVIDETGVRLVGVVPKDEKFSISLLNNQILDDNIKAVKELDRIIKRLNNQTIELVI